MNSRSALISLCLLNSSSKTVSFFILSHFGTFVKWIFYEQVRQSFDLPICSSSSRSPFTLAPCDSFIIISRYLVFVKYNYSLVFRFILHIMHKRTDIPSTRSTRTIYVSIIRHSVAQIPDNMVAHKIFIQKIIVGISSLFL